MTSSVRERIKRRNADHHAGLAPNVGRHANMARYVFILHTHGLANFETPRLNRLAARPDRSGELKAAASQSLKFLASSESLLHQKCSKGGQVPLKICRRHVMARLHALDGMALLVHVVDVAA